MPPYVTQEKTDILRHALQKLQKKTPITSIGPGAVARALAEVVVNEIGDFYSVMDHNTAMGLISSAQGRALDLIGELYNVDRKRLSEIATIDESIGAFYFYLEAPHTSDILIPQGTRIFTDNENYIGDQFTYVTTMDVTIVAGRTRVYVPIRPEFTDSVFTAGQGTLTQHNLEGPEGVTVHSTNPKAIAPQPGYESDANFRQRIQKAVRTAAGGTLEALRFAGLAVAGVREVKIRATPYGLGSVEALVVPERRQQESTANQPATVEVVTAVIDELDKVRPAGVRLFVREPDYTRCAIRATIVLRDDISVDPEGTARRAEIGIIRYLNTLLPGDKLVYAQLIQAVLEASDAIADVEFTRFRMGGREVLRQNFRPEEDHQIIPGDEIRVTVA